MTATDFPFRLAALLFLIPGLAWADGYAALNYGSGPDDYRSYSFTGNVALSGTVSLTFDHFLARTTGTIGTRETGAGLSWQVLDAVAADYRHSETRDSTFAVKGNEGSLSFALDALWEGSLQTSLDLGYGSFGYRSANPQTVMASSFELNQNRKSYSLRQELASFLTLYGSHDQYQYDRNVRGLAIFLLKRSRNTSRMAFRLLSFPDKTDTLGMNWSATDAIRLDASYSQTTTLLDQQLKNIRIGADYQAGDHLNLGLALTRSIAAAVVNRSGAVLQPETRDNYWDLTVGWSF